MGPLGRPGEPKRPATQRRGPWPGAIDDSGCKTEGPHRGLGGRWWVGGMGDGPWVVPGDGARRRPNPVGTRGVGHVPGAMRGWRPDGVVGWRAPRRSWWVTAGLAPHNGGGRCPRRRTGRDWWRASRPTP